MTPIDIRKHLVSQRIVPVVRLDSTGLAERACDYLVSAGFSAIEIALTVPGAIPLIERLAGRLDPDVLVGIGPVLDLETARHCIDSGARFLTTPCVVRGIAKMAHPAGCAVLLGGFTPGEILAAQSEGADIVRIFPASSGGPEHLRTVHRVFPDLLLCPSGGVSLQNIEAYFAAGAAVVAVGNHILDEKAIAAGNAAVAIAHARRFVSIAALPPAPARGAARHAPLR